MPKQVTGIGFSGTLKSENRVVVTLASVKLEITVCGTKECITDQMVLIKEDGSHHCNGQSWEEAETVNKMLVVTTSLLSIRALALVSDRYITVPNMRFAATK